jgi:transposase-like protein
MIGDGSRLCSRHPYQHRVDGKMTWSVDSTESEAYPSPRLSTGKRHQRTVLPHVEHRTSNYLNSRLERDHQHLKGRIRPMRWFKTVGGASNFSRGHALIRNLCCGFSSLTAKVPVRLRLATAWSARAATL